MTASAVSRQHKGRRVAIAATVAALCAGIGGWLAVDDASGRKASTVGETKHEPKPSCPGSPCEAVGSVTGFQARVGSKRNVFKMPEDGKIVAWSVALSSPSSAQREFFGDFYRNKGFGTKPSARLGILRLVNKKKRKFKLTKQSPAVNLSGNFGRTPLFTLDSPLNVKEGRVIALTVPSWLPAFAVDLSNRHEWRASRNSEKCSGASNIKNGRPQQKVGQVRTYGCRYRTARLLYWAYYVKS